MNLKFILISLLLSTSFYSSAQVLRRGVVLKVRLQNEYVVLVEGKNVSALKNLVSRLGILTAKDTRVAAMTGSKITVVKIKSNLRSARRLSQSKLIKAIGPNFQYIGDPREFYNDPFIKQQGHLKIISAPLVWKRGLQGSPNVVVAITDDGVDLSHPDLASAIWQNKKEIAGNGIDDDGNGYIDDSRGWDFSDGDNNPSGGSHGTHVAGIVAAVGNNGIGVAGTAAGVTVMPIRWYGGRNRWTTTMIAESYAYALNNGANIINTSYRIDQFASDKIYLSIVKILKERGVLLFNSAGNGNEKNPRRQTIEDITLVASTYGQLTPAKEIDVRSSFSNYGTGIDIAAPGGQIMATCLGGGYCLKSGTSMAAPNAAATAALIWSVFPKLNSEQVLHKLFTSSSNIDERNPKYKGLLGAGRINLADSVLPNVRIAQIFPIGFNKATGEFLYKVHGVLNKLSLRSNLQRILINGEEIVARLRYSGNILRVGVGKKLSVGKYNVQLAKGYLRDVFGRAARFKQALGTRNSHSQIFNIKN